MVSADQAINRFGALDGWRGISILLVLGGHLLPLGPARLQLNDMAGPAGMALFFTLSGFLITHFLLRRPDVRDFAIRRLCRILPLAWLYIVIALLYERAPASLFRSHLFFYANLPPAVFTDTTAHLWSVCMEVQFYALVGLLVLLLGRRGLLILPFACVAITALRIVDGEQISIVTWHRVDEILAGCILALAFHRGPALAERYQRLLNPWLLGVAFLISCHPASGAVNYARPYLAALLVASTLFWPRGIVGRVLETGPLHYIAEISYALYVIHPLVADTWLGSGDRVEMYAKRPLMFAVTFGLAHLSTFLYEKPWVAWGRRRTAARSTA